MSLDTGIPEDRIRKTLYGESKGHLRIMFHANSINHQREALNTYYNMKWFSENKFFEHNSIEFVAESLNHWEKLSIIRIERSTNREEVSQALSDSPPAVHRNVRLMKFVSAFYEIIN